MNMLQQCHKKVYAKSISLPLELFPKSVNNTNLYSESLQYLLSARTNFED